MEESLTYSDEHGFHFGPDDTLGFPVCDGEFVQLDGTTHGVGLVMDRGVGSLMFLLPVPKGPTCLTNTFHFASWMVTLIPVYYPSFAGDVPPVLGGH